MPLLTALPPLARCRMTRTAVTGYRPAWLAREATVPENLPPNDLTLASTPHVALVHWFRRAGSYPPCQNSYHVDIIAQIKPAMFLFRPHKRKVKILRHSKVVRAGR